MTIEATEAESRRDLLLVDIRPLPERLSELGFLPGSLSLPLEGDDREQLALLEALPWSSGLVLCCTSGRRSARAWAAFEGRLPGPLFHLEGGLLAWGAAGLPLCKASEEAPDPPADLLDFRRRLIACFVAENTEVALDRDAADANPYADLRGCFAAAGVPWDHPTLPGFYRVLDQAALATRRAGGNSANIARNLSAMYAMLRALEP